MRGELCEWLPTICRRGSRADGESIRRVGRRVILAAMVIAVLFAGTAATAGTDPRVCKTSDGRAVPRLECGKGAAKMALRRYMTARFQSHYLWSGIVICRAFAGLIRYRCDFSTETLTGYALVSLGSAPAWKPTVAVKQLVCDDPDRVGC